MAFADSKGILDHIVIGCRDLDEGAEWFTAKTGVRMSAGGRHRGRGTRNILASLSDTSYLEIIAPDPGEPETEFVKRLKLLDRPQAITWAVALPLQLVMDQFPGETIRSGSRERWDGKVLRWKTILTHEQSGAFPFLIEWEDLSLHPGLTAAHGLRLVDLQITYPNPSELTKLLQQAAMDIPVVEGPERISFTLQTPLGQVRI